MKYKTGDKVLVVSLDWTEDVGIAGREATVSIRDSEQMKYAIRFDDDGTCEVVEEGLLMLVVKNIDTTSLKIRLTELGKQYFKSSSDDQEKHGICTDIFNIGLSMEALGLFTSCYNLGDDSVSIETLRKMSPPNDVELYRAIKELEENNLITRHK